MRADRNDRRFDNLLFKNEVVADEIKKNVEEGIESTTCGIAESSQRNELSKGGIEKIYR